MNYEEYIALVAEITSSEQPAAPYDQEEYISYTKLNESRMKRWTKNMVLREDLVQVLENITTKQHWIIITEPWCGDAAHLVPFLVRFAELSPAITYELQLRDTERFLIDQYLTNGGKAIPKLISRGEDGNDVFVWGPRPANAQLMMDELKAKDTVFEEIKIELQNWYNKDKGAEVQEELFAILANL